ncbi:MAG TPA: hypothetical protein VES67_22975 [Vicinamibacterales bacterium]|nr:hypothetical protein [Vicinamibacterales bacterium]
MSDAFRRLSLVLAVALMWAASGDTAWACPVCFRMEDGPVADGVFAAVLVLMGVTSSVLVGFAVFIHGFVRRASKMEGGNQ